MIWNDYQKIVNYCANYDLFEKVRINENFYNGRQWEGLKTKNLPQPVINILQRCVKYMVASLVSNDVSVSMLPFSDLADDTEKIKAIAKEVERVIEQARIKEASRLVVRDGAVNGASYMLQEFNADIETGQPMKGKITNRIVDNTNMFFGNPYSNDIQTQPWIIVALRQNLSQVREEASRLGVDPDTIHPDNDLDLVNDDSDDLVTVLLKFEKRRTVKKIVVDGILVDQEENVSVWFTKCTQDVELIPPTDLEYKRYPITCFGWDPIKNSYLYESPMTAVIPNQIFINKTFAIAQMYAQQSAFPKIIYDKSKADIDDLLDNTTASAVANIDMMGKFLDFIKVPDFSNNILSLLDQIIQQTKECMGINDASLGNVKAENTSAIIALQEGTNIPLELQRQEFYEMWEDVVRNILDIMACTYHTRQVLVDGKVAEVNFDMLRNLNYDVSVDIGAGAQFSEIAQVNTLDKLLQNGLIDATTYVESVPNKYIPNKAKILQSLKELKNQY